MSDKTVITIVQARMASERLPGKVLTDIHGQSMLARVVNRARAAQSTDGLIVATSTDLKDDAIEDECLERGIEVFRGHPTDVLDRCYQAAMTVEASVVVRLTADCPLIDPGLIDDAIRAFLTAEPPVDFVSNRLPDQRTYPVGTDVEVCSIEALHRAWNQADQPHQREHVMPYLYEEPGRFKTLVLKHDADLSWLRLTVDEQSDLEFVRQIYERLGNKSTWIEVVDLIEGEPSLMEINASIEQKGLHT